MASKTQKQDTTPKIVVTEQVSLTLASTEGPYGYYHQPDFAVLEDFVEQVKDYFGLEVARSLVDLNIAHAGITATVRTEK